MEQLKAKLFLLKYRFRYKNSSLYSKAILALTIFFILIFASAIYFLKPLDKIKMSIEERFSKIESPKIEKNIEVSGYTSTSTNQTYIKPVNGVITSGYGYRYSEFHTGIDVSCYTHRDNVLAVADGVVVFAGVQNSYGNCIEIEHEIGGNKIYSFYAHLYSINVSVGQRVSQGQIIAREGGDPYTDPNHGNSTGHHLHFELRQGLNYGSDINPTFIFV